MPPSFDFGDWFGKEAQKGTPVVVKMENPNWDMLELHAPNKEGFEGGKGKNKNAKQLTWVLLLKAHRAAGCVAYLAMGFWTLLSAIKKRLIMPKSTAPALEKPVKGKLFKFIRASLILAVFLLCVEVGAHMMGWHFSAPTGFNLWTLPHAMYGGCVYLRAKYIGPTLQFAADSCIVLFLIQSADRIIQCLGCLWINVMKIKPIPVNPSFESDDLEQPDKGYPMVLMQIPMCNEREVRNRVILPI